MEIKGGIHPLRNLSLKWSFFIYAAVGIIAALLFTVLFNTLFENLKNNIYNIYQSHRDEIAQYATLTDAEGNALQGGIWIYSKPLEDEFSEEDRFLFSMYSVLSVLVVPVVWIICVLAVGILFYLRKLKKPLQILDKASARIAGGDLDYTLEYASRNEFGRLTASFETMRKALLETNREMWRMIEGRKQLNAAFAHDLRTPLTVLRGYLDFLRRFVPEGGISDDKALETLATMGLYISRLEGYTEAMSSVQKLEELSLEPADVEYESLCGDIKEAAGHLAGDKRLDFEAAGSGIIHADSPAVACVCENLLSNAARYAKSSVAVRCYTDGRILRVTVKDDGPGFSAEALKKAALPYYRGEKDLADIVHFGMGLYTSKLLCEKHGGSLQLENEIGGAVTAEFHVTAE
ncbi:MAG: HAMP domain-containing histidine kinase [Clostridiales bacterium]|jgi:signal transduction histidine kinase|nr:HAMP domain-containing histidine kinase [Clostridiales bacterium]